MKFTLEVADKKGQLIMKVQVYSFEALEAILEVLKEKGLIEE